MLTKTYTKYYKKIYNSYNNSVLYRIFRSKMSKKNEEQSYKMITFRISKEKSAKLFAKSLDLEMPVSTICRMAVFKYLDEL